jgi:hypothetical protein
MPRIQQVKRARKSCCAVHKIVGLAFIVAMAAGAAQAAVSKNAARVELAGRITPACTLTLAAGQVTLGDISRPGSGEANYTVNCNAPFTYTLTSRYGAFQNVNVTSPPPGAVARVPYTVHVHIPTDDVTISDHCDSGAIQAGRTVCAFSNSRNGIAINRTARLTLAWKPLPRLVAGTYGDTLTLMLSAQV